MVKPLFLGLLGLLGLLFWSCTAPAPPQTPSSPASNVSTVQHVGAMRNVMWKGELGASVQLDTIRPNAHLLALGPVSGLRGEIMALDGEVYVSRVSQDAQMTVEKEPKTGAPFLVYANVPEWQEIPLPATLKSIPELEALLDSITQTRVRPFALKLEGKVASALIHVQNLAPGTNVSSPQEAHQGQVKYPLKDVEATIAGFFSTEHQGIFTHHDAYLHLHLLTADEQAMGHLDALEIGKMKLYLSRQ